MSFTLTMPTSVFDFVSFFVLVGFFADFANLGGFFICGASVWVFALLYMSGTEIWQVACLPIEPRSAGGRLFSQIQRKFMSRSPRLM
jgi:hypothetical protein